VKNVSDYYASFNRLEGPGDEYIYARRTRILALNIDGIPFGDWPLDHPKFPEADMLANALASNHIDGEIDSIRSLPERGTVPTPDFEATLRSGAVVRIEVTTFADPVVRRYVGDLNSIFTPLQSQWPTDPEIAQAMKGIRIVFSFPGPTPPANQRQAVRDEILSIMRRVDTNLARSLNRFAVPSDCPVLQGLGASFILRPTEAAAGELKYDPNRDVATVDGIVDAAAPILASKIAKFDDYSAGGTIPVWLAIFVGDGISYKGLTAIQKLAHSELRVDPGPFDRLLVGNYVVGFYINREPPDSPAYYHDGGGVQQVIARA